MYKTTEIRKQPGLNERQKRFVDYYLQSSNATESAKKAGYSPKNAYQVVSVLLKNTKIQTALNTRLAEMEINKNELEISANVPIVVVDDI